MHGVEWGKIQRLPQRITYHYSPEPSAPTEEKTSQPSSKKPSASQNRKPPILKCLKKVGTPGGDTTMKWEDDGAWRGECSIANYVQLNIIELMYS